MQTRRRTLRYNKMQPEQRQQTRFRLRNQIRVLRKAFGGVAWAEIQDEIENRIYKNTRMKFDPVNSMFFTDLLWIPNTLEFAKFHFISRSLVLSFFSTSTQKYSHSTPPKTFEWFFNESWHTHPWLNIFSTVWIKNNICILSTWTRSWVLG